MIIINNYYYHHLARSKKSYVMGTSRVILKVVTSEMELMNNEMSETAGCRLMSSQYYQT